MISLEIAELLKCRHDNVKGTIERLVSARVIELPPMEEVKNHLGQTIKVYNVDKRSSHIVVAQLSPQYTARLVDKRVIRRPQIEFSEKINNLGLPQKTKLLNYHQWWKLKTLKGKQRGSTFSSN